MGLHVPLLLKATARERPNIPAAREISHAFSPLQQDSHAYLRQWRLTSARTFFLVTGATVYGLSVVVVSSDVIELRERESGGR